ncbi:aspartyl-phosphate phosphatase Spo0E family protein [Ruminiclostridium cellobioparum]|uniref:aspartyl-phosphate phosphatase Spo0E family protein n=1 Tax=Ruminiclostridium cellobioparum TaxID=29355 RepID=UPI000554A3F6|nr:aspartyl-phosphate phosphatase Spo0E family protein [Ruminiclostridium cellobioparum]
MLTDKINELREELNKQVISRDIHKQSVLRLSQELDRYIVEYLKNKDGKKVENKIFKKKQITYRKNIE